MARLLSVFFRPPHARAAASFGIAALTLTAVVLFFPLLGGGRVLYFGDIGLYFIPMVAFLRRELLAGTIPLWNPHSLFGTPFVGNPQTWPLYPSTILVAALPAPVAVGVVGALHALLAAVGMLLFLRRRRFSLAPSLLGALAFGFGGALVSKMQFPNMVQAAAYLPWLLWGVDRLIDRPIAARTASFALLVGLSLLAAHPQIFLMEFYLGLAWAIRRLTQVEPDRRIPAMIAVAVGFLLGALLAAAQLLPAVEMMRESVRAHMSLGKANRFYLPLEMLLSVFVEPNFYGNPATGVFVGHGNFWEVAAYVGVLPFLLAVGVMWRRYRADAEARFWTVAFWIFLWLSLGRIGGLYALAFFFVPGVNKFHDPARWLLPVDFALACLAAIGFEATLAALRRSGSGRISYREHFALIGGVLLVSVVDLLLFSRTLNPTVPGAAFATEPPAVKALRALPEGRLYQTGNAAVWRSYASYRSYNPQSAERVGSFLNTLGPNLSQAYGLRDADGYEPVRRRNVNALRAALDREAAQAALSPTPMPLSSSVGVRYVLSLRPRPLPSPDLAVVGRYGDTWIQENPGASPRVRLWTGWRTADDPDAALETFLERPEGAPVVPVAAGAALPESRPGNRLTWPATIVAETPDRVVVAVEPGASGGLLALLDADHPGWRARIDGRDADIVRVNGLFRGVFVKSGVMRVEFRYVPAVFQTGLYLSLCSLGSLVGIIVFARCRTRSQR